jgi:hypothetical protein
MQDPEQERFLKGDVDSFLAEFSAPVGQIKVTAEKVVTCSAEWGGWHWQAEGGSRDVALRRLFSRIDQLDPFSGSDTDWGEPGDQTDQLDDAIPPEMKARMRDWTKKQGFIIPEDDDES